MFAASLQQILSSYFDRSPTSSSAYESIADGHFGSTILHDHLAFRTYGVDGLGKDTFGSVLESFGYTRQDNLTFTAKKLLATWYSPPRDAAGSLPRIFVSEIKVEQLSPRSQEIIQSYTSHLRNTSPVHIWTAALTNTLMWRQPHVDDYHALLRESEYAAWVLVNGYSLNHTALSVHGLSGFDGDLLQFSEMLAAKGFKLNNEGGMIKVSPDGALLQSSTVADVLDFTFAGGQKAKVAGAYMEFVERKPLTRFAHLPRSELREEHRRDGFETSSADNIFASTTLAVEGRGQRAA